MKKFVRPLITILLITAVLTQGGGGGGGGGGGDSGGGASDSGGSSSNTGGDAQSCAEKCGKDTTCLADCQRTNKIVGGVVGGIFGVAFIGFFLCFYYKCSLDRCVCLYVCCPCNKGCPCHEYQSLKRKYNNVDGENMSVEEFVSKRDNIIENLKLSEKQGNYYFFQKETKYVVHITSVTIVREEKPLLTQIKLEGKDHFGTWRASGSIMSKNNQIFVWLYKQYNDRPKAGQTGKWSHLIHESLPGEGGRSLQGKWFYKGFQHANDYSGSWALEFKESQAYWGNQKSGTIPSLSHYY